MISDFVVDRKAGRSTLDVFAERLRIARHRQCRAAPRAERLTQQRLAERLGMAASAITAWETGGRLPKDPDVMAQLADELNVSVDWLLGRDSAA